MSHSPIRSVKAALLLSSLALGVTQTALAQEAEAPAEEKSSWTDDISVGAFVDAYGALVSDANDTRVDPFHRAYVRNDGFQLSFAGADLAYSGEQFGATISLRFGPSVGVFYAADKGPTGIDNITQAYVTWKPTDSLTLDLGQFGTLYGAEVAESWRNKNYTRGALYYAFQPFWHTGLRANYAVNDTFGINAMIVNGVNTEFEGNKSPSVGVQALITPSDELFFAVGYLGALNPRDGDEGPTDFDGDGIPDGENQFENFFDVVATAAFGDFSLTANFDLNLYRVAGAADAENFWGVSVAPGYAFTNWFGAAARVEYLVDSNNGQLAMPGETAGESTNLLTLTGTLDFKPVPNSSALVLRPEFRYEKASVDNFNDADAKPTDGYWQAVLGAVVTSM